jgi:hypothetical protein
MADDKLTADDKADCPRNKPEESFKKCETSLAVRPGLSNRKREVEGEAVECGGVDRTCDLSDTAQPKQPFTYLLYLFTCFADDFLRLWIPGLTCC